MPSTARIRWAKFRISAVSFVALLILGVLVALLTGGNLFQNWVILYTYMPDAAGLGLKSPVRLNGIPVGLVTDVRLSNLPDPNKVIRVAMRIEYGFLSQIPRDSMGAITSENVVGEKYLDLTRGQSPQLARSGDTLPFQPAPDVLKALDLAQFESRLRAIDTLLAEIQQGKTGFGKLVMGEDLYWDTVRSLGTLQRALDVAIGPQRALGQFLYSTDLYNRVRTPHPPAGPAAPGRAAGRVFPQRPLLAAAGDAGARPARRHRPHGCGPAGRSPLPRLEPPRGRPDPHGGLLPRRRRRHGRPLPQCPGLPGTERLPAGGPRRHGRLPLQPPQVPAPQPGPVLRPRGGRAAQRPGVAAPAV